MTRGLLVFILLATLALPAVAAAQATPASEWPTPDQWVRVLTLRDYNTRVVVLGTTLLGIAAGVIGSFTLLRKRALMGDALSHATLPGIAIAFIVGTMLGMAEKSLPLLLLGATVTGVLGVGVILFLRRYTRIKEDAALGVVLSVFFGAGGVMLDVIQKMNTGSAAGLESFIFGKTASMVSSDVMLIAGAGVMVIIVCALLFKEFKLLCFDPAYAAFQGWPTLTLDILMMALVVTVTVIGLQAVGLILVIALLIIPAAAARFWTDRMLSMMSLSAMIGGASAMIGAAASALLPKLPSGAMIVLTAAALFAVSMAFGRARGVLPRFWRRYDLNRQIGKQHLLRAIYELLEARGEANILPSPLMPLETLMPRRAWSRGRLRRLARSAERSGRVILDGRNLRLTEAGLEDARRVVRNHRLWELYLITHADVAPSHVDRDADMIEHVLSPDMIARLEGVADDAQHHPPLPQSPHPIAEARHA